MERGQRIAACVDLGAGMLTNFANACGVALDVRPTRMLLFVAHRALALVAASEEPAHSAMQAQATQEREAATTAMEALANGLGLGRIVQPVPSMPAELTRS